MANLSAPGSTALDVGANVGQSSSVMARAVGRRGLVIALEPLPDAFDLLQKGTRGMNVVPLPFAAGSEEQLVELYVPVDARGDEQHQLASVIRVAGETRSVPVRMMRLDSLRAIVPGALSLIKIDVEGYELSVLRGGNDLLAELRPALIVEVEARHQPDGQQVSDVFSHILDLGYRVEGLSPAGPIPLDDFDVERDQLEPLATRRMDMYINNFIAVRE